MPNQESGSFGGISTVPFSASLFSPASVLGVGPEASSTLFEREGSVVHFVLLRVTEQNDGDCSQELNTYLTGELTRGAQKLEERSILPCWSGALNKNNATTTKRIGTSW